MISRKDILPSEAIGLEIAERTNVDLIDLPPLYESFDPEALDRLIQGQGACHVAFVYAGYEVIVSETGSITIHKRGSDRS